MTFYEREFYLGNTYARLGSYKRYKWIAKDDDPLL
jgi:hypothetical protein